MLVVGRVAVVKMVMWWVRFGKVLVVVGRVLVVKMVMWWMRFGGWPS